MPRSLKIKPVAARLAAGLAAVSLLTVPAVATASVAHTTGAPASHSGSHHRRHHRRHREVRHVIRRGRAKAKAPAHVTKATPVTPVKTTTTAPVKTTTITTAPVTATTTPTTPTTPITPITPTTPTAPVIPTPAPASSPFFSSTSIWNQQVTADTALDPNSSTMVNDLVQQETNSSVSVQTTTYGVPIYTVAANQPTVAVKIASNAILNAAMSAVPLPPNAVPAAGTDGNLAVWQPSTDTMWEFWRLTNSATGWNAEWGGVMDNVSSDPGYYTNIESTTGVTLQRNNWGAPATSFPLVAGVMTISELESGQINHALSLALPQTLASEWIAPAQRTDGRSTASDAIPEGAHFRLNPNLNLASLNLPHFVYVMALAAQQYGIIINNTSAGVAFRAEDPTQFIAQNGYNPYMGPANKPGTTGALFSQWPSQMLRLFPWSQLQLLPMSAQTQVSTIWTTR